MTGGAYRIDDRPASREAFYAVACDPRRPVCVEACAGAGKTWMLVARIVRALLDGAAPQEILAITFTRKAAGEMRERLAEWLREASGFTPAKAAERLMLFGFDAREAAERAPSLIGLHERVLDSGRQVQVHTIHAWYAQLLAAAPLELLSDLGLAPDLALIEDTADLVPALMRRFHAQAMREPQLREDQRQLCTRHGRANLARWLEAALERRNEILLAADAGALRGGVPPAADTNPLARVRASGFVADVRALARALGQRKAVTAQQQAAALLAALDEADDAASAAALRAVLFTKKNEPRKLGDAAGHAAACAELDAIDDDLAQQRAHEDHAAMSRLALALFAQYAALARERGVVDMNELERLAYVLLAEHDLAAWVQQRLDARVRHLLIDEFQDTSPLQWHALEAWLSAYAGAGGGAGAPGVFIVGDPKQSIYRFRRAEPKLFDAAQRFVVEALGGHVLACDHTRRCAPGIVRAVNGVFGGWDGSDGLPHWRDHTTEVQRDAWPQPVAGLPTIERDEKARAGDEAAREASVWRPSLTVPKLQARVVRRASEADEVARAVARLIRHDQVAAQDIFVLARRNAVLALAADALAAQQVPHVAPEDLRLADLPEVQDLLAVLDVLASPTQTLSLARALKSPLFGADDIDLLDLSRRAEGHRHWWPVLCGCADDVTASPALQRAARLLERWAGVAATLPPHDLLDRIADEGDLIARLAAAAPPARRARALDAVRALLAAALEVDGGRYASPYGFVRALRARRIDAPATQHEGAVRLATIHGAKGLEARIVFLMDTQPERTPDDAMSVWVDWPAGARRPQRVAFVASDARCPPSLRDWRDAEAAADAREEANALYVAMTRARERLIASRTPPRGADSARLSWWSRLAPWAPSWQAPASEAGPAVEVAAEFATLPSRRASAPAAATVSDRAPTAAQAAADVAAALGHALHRTLEWATQAQHAAQPRELAPLARAAAQAFPPADAQAVEQIAERVLASAACRALFDPQAIEWVGNEVVVSGLDGRVRRIDRLVLLRAPRRAWWVIDYKLAGTPQNDPALLAQLADYRECVAALVPGETVRAAFVTARGELVEPAAH